MTKKFLAFILFAVMCISLCACNNKDATASSELDNVSVEAVVSSSLVVHFIDVGQGDCTLVQSGGKSMLIDSGEKSYAQNVISYLKSYSVSTLDYVVCTHPHTDHYGAMQTVLESFDCKNFLTCETDQTASAYISLLTYVADNGINYLDANIGDEYTIGNSSFTVLAPSSVGYEDYNNYSVVLRLVCGDTSIILTGDAEKESEDEMLELPYTLKSDVLKVGHHGSTTSTSSEFLSAVDPKYAVISCGNGNDYGHPHEETLTKLNNENITVFRTDKSGSIVACSDSKNIRFYSNGKELLALPTEATENKLQSTEQPATAAKQTDDGSYIGNKNSKKFHLPDCSGVAKMSDKNKVFFNSRDEAVNSGYSPCSLCKP